MEIEEEPCRIKDEDTEEQIGEEEASRRNYSRRNHRHTIVKMEIKEEPCRIKDEDTEQQIDPMEVNDDKQHYFTNEEGEQKYKNEDKQNLFQESHHFKNEDGDAVVSKTEENFTQTQAGKSGDKGSFTCSECGLFHIEENNTEENLLTCIHWGKRFTQKRPLYDHLLLSHSVVQRSFSCDQCEKTFVGESNLKRHLQIHSTVKPHICSFRGKSFALLTYLKVHERIHTSVRAYVCSDCGHSYTTNAQLKKHQRIHTGEKPYKCSHCSKCFSRSGTLKDHERVHTGERPYHCSSCEERFTQLAHLRTHEKKGCPKLPIAQI